MAKNVEKRYVQADLEVRSEEGKPTVIEGYAAVFGDETVIGGAFAERVSRNAFEGANMSNTVALFNHDVNQPLARVGHGLDLEIDERGLKYRFELGNQSYAKDLAENIRMGNVSTSSFGFTVKEDSWERRSDGLNLRTIEKIDLLFDVSPTTQGAYPTTEVGLRSMEAALANEAVAELEEEVTRSEEEVVAEAPAAGEEDCGCDNKAIEPVQRAEEAATEEVAEEEEEETEEKAEEGEQEERVEELVDTSILPHPYALDENPEPEARSNNNNSTNMENKEKNAPAYIQGLGDVAEKLQKRYDFGKAIREAAQGKLTGLEAEMNQEARTEFAGSKVNVSGGINVPSSMLFRDAASTAIGVTNSDNGAGAIDSAAFGGQIGKVDSGLIGSFQPADLASQLGVRNLTRATGDIYFQVQTTDPSIATPNEAVAAAASNPGFTARYLSPKRYSAHVQVTEQLLAQSSQDMGAFIAQEIRKAIDAKFSVDVDAAIVAAADDHETLAGTMDAYNATTNNITHLEAELLGRNVDVMNVRAACSPTAYRNARTSSFDTGSGLVFAGSPRDRIAVIGYPAAVNSKVANNGLYLIDITQMVQATWGGMNLIIDPYTDADKGVVRIIANVYRDVVALNHDGFAGFAG